MDESERWERAADSLCDVTMAMEDVDLNALDDREAYEFLEYKLALGEMNRQYRRRQHNQERFEAREEQE